MVAGVADKIGRREVECKRQTGLTAAAMVL